MGTPNDYLHLRRLDISCVFKSALIAVVKSVSNSEAFQKHEYQRLPWELPKTS